MKPPPRVIDALQFALILSALIAATTAPDWLPAALAGTATAARGCLTAARDCLTLRPSEGGPVP